MSIKKLQQIISTLETELKEPKQQQNIDALTDADITQQIATYKARIETLTLRFPEELQSVFMQPYLHSWWTALQDLKKVQQKRNSPTH